MRWTWILAGALLLSPAVAAEALRLRQGAVRVLELPENPSTGYSWRIDADASAGLERLSIEDRGRRRGADRPGAPGFRRWAIRALAPGRAIVVFAYQRPWEPAPVERRRLEVSVTR